MCYGQTEFAVSHVKDLHTKLRDTPLIGLRRVDAVEVFRQQLEYPFQMGIIQWIFVEKGIFVEMSKEKRMDKENGMRWIRWTRFGWFVAAIVALSVPVPGTEVAASPTQVPEDEAGAEVSASRVPVPEVVVAITGVRVPESYDPALRGPSLPRCVLPGDVIPHPTCTPFQVCSSTDRIWKQYVGHGVMFSPAVGIFDDPPEHWAGVNPADNILDLITPVEGKITLFGSTIGSTVLTAVDYLAVSAGNVFSPTDLVLEVFNSTSSVPIDSRNFVDGFDSDGKHLAIIDHTIATGTGTGADISGFKVSTPTFDSFGVRRICFDSPDAWLDDPPRDPCVVHITDGIVSLPPEGCAYLSPSEFHAIVDILGDTDGIELKAIHTDYICDLEGCGDGDPSDGDIENFDSVIVLELQGFGGLSDFRRVLVVPAAVTTETGPRDPGGEVQDLPTQMRSIQASLVGDPDFDLFQIIAGTDNGFPSPGVMSLTDNGDGTFGVDGSFEIGFTVGIEGAVGGGLEGVSGTFPGTVTVGVTGTQIFSDGFESGDTLQWLSLP